ncbi:MAG: hypothetical protein HRU38_15775 [Saccharospirillaceae bacterium]|nr:hypothetical protein [Pseudomonadales bacterium]NRB80100.1 hypothetical protein [Saccharospirillaceae bacterium]
MGTVEWLVLFGAACLIIGSFSYMKPTPKQKREAKIRMKAIHLGLRIKQLDMPDLSVTGRVNNTKAPLLFFQLQVPAKVGAEKRIELENRWIIQRTTGESGIYLQEGWAWNLRSTEKTVIEFLEEFLKTQNEHIQAIEVNKYYVAISWDERPNDEYTDTLMQDLKVLMQFSIK